MRVCGGLILACSMVIGLVAQASCSQPQRNRDTAIATQPAAEVAPRQKRRFGRDYFPNVTLRTHDNRAVRFYDDLLKDKIVVLNLFYSQCTGSCPPVMNNLRRVQKILHDRIGKDIFIYSISIKPEEDTPEVLAEFAHKLNVGPGWYLLTGDPGDIELLRRKLGYVDPDPKVDADKASHIGMVRYGNEALERWGASPGFGKPEWLARSILFVDNPVTGNHRVAAPR